LLWLVLVILSWYGSALLIIAAWDAFVTSPISFGAETTYLNWETKMPAVAICEMFNDAKIYNVSDTYTLVEVCYLTKKPDPMCPTSNFRYYAELVRSDCDQMVKNCSYNDKEFNCCEYFQTIDTDLGKIHNRGLLKFDLMIASTRDFSRQITIRNIENDPLIVETNSEQRACRFHYENENGIYPLYSYSACTVRCRKKGQMDMCGCNDHFMLGTSEYINLITLLVPRLYRAVSQEGTNGYGRVSTLTLLLYSYRACTVRCRKKGQMDMCGCNDHFMLGTMSVGGTTGLFVGASVLSFIELIFFFTVRFVSNILMGNKKPTNVVHIRKLASLQ
ncbi:putative pickpocket 13, partial [Operophtera brumata]